MSFAPTTPADENWPRRFNALPNSPLTTEQLEVVEEAYERTHDGVTIWVGNHPEEFIRILGDTTIASEKQTILKFLVETSEHFQVYQYSPQPGGGYWEQCAPTSKDDPQAELWETSLGDEADGYTPLAELDQEGEEPR